MIFFFFGLYTMLYDHHHYLILEHFYPAPQKNYSLAVIPIAPSPNS